MNTPDTGSETDLVATTDEVAGVANTHADEEAAAGNPPHPPIRALPTRQFPLAPCWRCGSTTAPTSASAVMTIMKK